MRNRSILNRRSQVIAAASALALLGAAPAGAMPLLIQASSGALQASAYFQTSGTNLLLTLSNTGGDVLVPGDVLTAIFFDVTGNPGLSSTSAVLNGGSGVLFGTSDPGGVVGGEWAYGSGLAGAPHGALQGVSSSGLGLFGAATFPGNNLQGPAGVDGLQYGITSSSDNPLTGNAAVTGSNALIQSSVVFTLGGLPSNFDPSTEINNVSFQYGTALGDVNLPGNPAIPVPEPASMLLLGGGLLGAGIVRKRRK